ncbi:murein hydrolase activator EnvC family protein [Roseofilum casamattae]|uniref:Peptidoglycan DD-metalloendopeptidase family protein n=1 Tax=Roseofilum casamattae BLCC-M143 TaxID=3022442 RepID=A0ABT7C0X1_9CYAN|nr:M23 family metallopeptidase [Roseofilum casamattae]MDJ1185102.1 peptidoglycan DD-metalloendopeptidase family protein [Roseofilum casamattae BLCC-M143]
MALRSQMIKEKQSQWWRWRMAIAIAFCLWLASMPALYASPSVDELQQIQQHLQDDRERIASEKKHLQKLEAAAENRLQGLQNSLDSGQTKLEDIESKITKTTANLEIFQGQLQEKEDRYEDLAQGAIARFRLLQRQPHHSGWAVLLQNETLTDFLSRRHRLQTLALADRQILLTVKEALNQTEQQTLDVEDSYNRLLLLRQKLRNQQNNYRTETAAQTQLIARLTNDREALQAAYLQLQEDSKGLEQLIRDRIAAAAALPLRKTLKLKPGKMLTPSYGNLSSSFGWRTHPVFGYERFHGGMDFAADYGAPIYAAHDGVVIFAGWYGGYGNTVILDRGNGITTLYGHASRLDVEEGQLVKQGDAIAETGSTGLSTGPHLHFEVRQDGTPVDPMDYLT